MNRLENKVALVTGGARGMGANHVRRFVAEGAKVYFTDIVPEAAQQMAAELGEQAVFIRQDVAQEADWQAVLSRIEQADGKLDVLVNNAAILRFNPFDQQSLADYLTVVNVNQVSVFLGMKTALPLLKKSGKAAIINISSVSGLKGMAGGAAYNSTKFAVRGLTQAGALEFAPFGIRVNSVHPGTTNTPMLSPEILQGALASIPLQRIGEPDDLTNMVLFLASDEGAFCTGGEYVVDGGYMAV